MLEQFLTAQINNYYVAVLFWNIFLALFPCFIAYRLSNRYHLKKWSNMRGSQQLLFGVAFLVWFFFLPNTAYLITDSRHLVDYCPEPGFYRACAQEAWVVPIFFTYALVGVPTFYYALSKMTYVLSKLFGQKMRFLFPFFMIPVTALGLLLGLVARFNSWEVVTKPLEIVRTAFAYFYDPTMLLNLVSYTLMLYLIYFTLHRFWKWQT